MFLDWIAQLRLLQHDSQTNILGSLPLSIRRVLISEITGYLNPSSSGKQPPDPSIFASPAHVKWFMEVIGQGFNLPLEDMAITNDDVDIYARWLFEHNTRPLAVIEEGLEQEFYQIIFHQFSLLFQPRITRTNNGASTTTAATAAAAAATSAPPISMQQPTQGGSGSTNKMNSFHITMMPVNAHSNLGMPFTPNPLPPSNPNNNPSNAQSALKETLSQLVQRHVELCKKTLKVFAMAGRTLKLSAETWSVLLKVMLGITDYLLKEPSGDTSNLGVMNMADELCDSLLQVLFELWLRSTIMDVEMWDILKSCFIRWTHRSKAIQQWSSTSLALTKRIQNLVYGEKEGTDGVYVNGPNIKLDLPAEFVYYAWHRVIYLIPHPLQLPPNNFTLAMLGIGNLVDTLNSSISGVDIVNHESSPARNPDGNTLLHMLGTYLFDAASKAIEADADSQRGCAEAYATLCKIFCKPQKREPFLRTYIERFYAALQVGLKSEACLPTILLSCTELFATDLEGVRMLVPDFISAIKMVLPKLRFECRTNVSIDNLRLAAIKVLSTIMCMPNHFDKVELHLGWDCEMNNSSLENVALVGEQEQLITQLIRVLYASPADGNTERPFLSLKFYILEVLLMSLRTETSSYNMRYILHLINVYVIEDVPFCPGLVGTVVKLIQDKILTMQLPADVTLVAFDVLMDFVDLYDFVKRDSKNVARELVLALSRYVDTLINGGKLAQTYPLIVQAYDCMIKWILVSQWIIDDRDCYKAVIATLSKGITIFDRENAAPSAPVEPVNVEKKKRRDTAFPPTKQLFQLPPRVNKGIHHNSHHHQQQDQHAATANSGSRTSTTVRKKEQVAVRMAAEYCMSQFVNQLGRFALPYEHALGGCRSAKIDDVAQLKQIKAKDKENWTEHASSIRYFLIDKRTLLTIIDVTDPQPKDDEPGNVPSIVVVIRDTTGKYVWSMETRYKDHNKPAMKSPTKGGTSDYLRPPSIHDKRSSIHKSTPPLPPQLQPQLTVPTATAVNEKEMPSMDKVFPPNSDEWNQWEMVKILMQRQETSEESHAIHNKDALIKCHVAPSTSNIDLNSPRGFRLLLSQIGFLLPKNRNHITPLHISDSVISEMETLDMLNERDCISISAYYAKSGSATWPELIETPPALSEQFIQFINCLGWPVNTTQHRGYKGKLDASICETIPYYSDRTVEFIVNVPYFLKKPAADTMEWGNMNTISKIHQQISSDDHICVIWIEDLAHYKLLASLIKASSSVNSKAMVYIFINPLKHSANGLYWVRILVPPHGNSPASLLASQRLNENALIFGPLVDGIVVSRHALGSMVRSTAISAHQACRVVTDTYTRPYVIRKEYIEEMAHRHRAKLPLSEFYSDVFAERDN
ncbi:hypothetical protein HMPREF1544_10155 [Mucor circinelloides 1006PhL]|uniref:Rap-GAP domain-containing protein n=1 Tax=Mucor circinelloides f. circinelloides (strain 1006PhL) TaxID=1220926 RepID=S2J4R3_MUCC1|nr:hypothetical protein HMPREF1544_10155 [Mucor circinelloides 1006PhL]